MCQAKDLMRTDVVTVDPDDSVEQALQRMLEHRQSGLPVVDGDRRLLGFISEFDLLELVWLPDEAKSPVYQHMSRAPLHVADDEPLDAVASLFRIESVRQLPVTREGRLLGVVHRADLLRHVLQEKPATAAPVLAMAGLGGGSSLSAVAM